MDQHPINWGGGGGWERGTGSPTVGPSERELYILSRIFFSLVTRQDGLHLSAAFWKSWQKTADKYESGCWSYMQEVKRSSTLLALLYMLWCNFVLGANFIFLCFGGMVMYDNV